MQFSCIENDTINEKEILTTSLLHVFSGQFPHQKVSLMYHVLAADLSVHHSGSLIHII